MQLDLTLKVIDLEGKQVIFPSFFESFYQFLQHISENDSLNREDMMKLALTSINEKDLTLKEVFIFLFNNSDLSKEDITLTMSIVPNIRNSKILNLNQEQVEFLKNIIKSTLQILTNNQAYKFWQIPLLFTYEILLNNGVKNDNN
jgi:hypothetical protein